MAQPYVGEVRMFAGNFAPVGWEFCDGQLLSISENETLFQLIGTTYGGDGESTFALPNLQSRIPIGQGAGYILAEAGGTESETLTISQIPSHSHALLASMGTGTQNAPAGELLASGSSISVYRPQTPSQPLSPSTISSAGGSQPHDNMVPFICVNFIISLFGIFPSPT